VIDEDVEGGTTAFMLQQIVEKQGAFKYLDSTPISIAAKITDQLMQVMEITFLNLL
jgi:hypothetical protein